MGELYEILKSGVLMGGNGGGSGFTPTTEQLAAMNSGINSTKVEEIATNSNKIVTLEAKTDLNIIRDSHADLNSLTWYNRIPHPTTGVPTSSSQRICTEKITFPQNTRSILCEFDDTDYKISIYTYDGDTLIQATYWYGTSPVLFVPDDNSKQYIIGVAYKNDAAINTSKKTALTGVTYQGILENVYCIKGEDINFVRGTLNPGTGIESESDKRLRSEYVYLGKGSRIVFTRYTNGYAEPNLIVYEFNSDKSYRSDSSWDDGNEYTVKNDGYCRILLRKNRNNPAISDDDIPVMTGQLKIYPTYPFESINNYFYKEFIPAYYNIDSKSADINSNTESVGVNGVSFAFCTDLHWENNVKRIGTLLSGVRDRTNIKYCIVGGDLINGGVKNNAVANIKECMNELYGSGLDIFCVRGNHDDNSIPAGNTLITDEEFYSICQSRLPNGAVYGDYAYFYFDDTVTRTRYIFLDSGVENTPLSTEQSEFLESALQSTEEGWHIIVTWHIVYKLASGTWSSVPLDLTPSAFSTSVFAILDDHNNNSDSTVEAIIGGHCHCDKNYETSGGIPIVLVDTASKNPLDGGTATTGTASETAFDVISIDYINKVIKCTRIGRGENRTIPY